MRFGTLTLGCCESNLVPKIRLITVNPSVDIMETSVRPPGNTVGSLTSTQHAVLVGSLLGDGSLRRQDPQRRVNALFEVNHAVEFRDQSPAKAMGSVLHIGLRREACPSSQTTTSGFTRAARRLFLMI